MRIELKNINALTPASYNPRKNLKSGDKEYESLKNSLKEFGYVEPIIWNDQTGNIVGGHQRLKALKELGITEAECVIVNLDEAHEKALNLALNKISGEWDNEKLSLVLEDLAKLDFDISLTGFNDEELELLLKDTIEVTEDDFDLNAELQLTVKTKIGDIWTLGQHRLICGDAIYEETYSRLMNEERANLVLTDPPYGVDVEEKAGKIKNDNLPDEDFYKFLLSAFKCMHSYLADDGSIYVWHADTKGLIFRRAYFEAGFYLSQICIWKKNMFTLGRNPYQYQHEPVIFGWKQKGKHKWYSDRKQTTIWEFDKPQKSQEHPTMKPIQLMAYSIKNSTKHGDIVLDPFGGSGSTLLACEQTGRNCFTSELDEKFCDVIVNRFIEYTGSSLNVHLERNGKNYSYDEIRGEQT